MYDLVTFTSGSIYLDTMIHYTFLRADSLIRPIIREFFQRIERGEITAYTSALTFDELAYRLLLALIKDKYDGSPLDQLRQNEAEMMAEFYPRFVPQLKKLHRFPNLTIVDVTAADIDSMMQYAMTYQLKPRDALHLAAMRTSGCINLASNDHHFDTVPDINRYFLSLP